MKQSPVRRRSLASLLPWLWLVWVAALLILLWKVVSSPVWSPASASADAPFPGGQGDLELVPTAVARFGAFVVEGGGGQVTRDRDHVAEGIDRLAEALMDIAIHGKSEDVRLRQRIDELGTMAAMLRDESLTRVQARVARHAFVVAAEVMGTLQAERYPHLDRATGEARVAALAIRTDRSFVAQGDEVQRFFERAHDVVRAMT